MPVRKIPKNYRNVTGIAAHRKAEGQAMFESTLERDFLMLLEFDSAVQRFDVQPLRLEWCDMQGKPHHYTPDVLASYEVEGQRYKVLYEVKYRSELRREWQILRPKFRAAVSYARRNGWRFKLITEVEIRTPFLENVKFLLPYIRRGPIEEVHMDLLDNQLIKMERTTPAELIAAVFKDEWNQARLLPTLWYLVGTQHFGVDLNTKLTMTSPIWRQYE